MTSCPICNSDDVVFTGHPRYQVEGRPTALCPHTSAHARLGKASVPIRFFTDSGEICSDVKGNIASILYAAGVPMGVNENGRQFNGKFLSEYCGILGLSKSVGNSLAGDSSLIKVLPKPGILDQSSRNSWPILLSPLYTGEGLQGLEVRYFSPETAFRPGDSITRDPGRHIRTVGARGLYLTNPHASPIAVVLFEGIWDAVAARWDAFENQNGDFVFGGFTANTSTAVILGALKYFFPGVSVVVVPDRDASGAQAMAKLKKHFPAMVLKGLNGPDGNGPKDYREADPKRRWQALLNGVEGALEDWERRKQGTSLGDLPVIVVHPTECVMVDASFEALRKKGGLFHRGNKVVYVRSKEADKSIVLSGFAGGSEIVEGNVSWLREELSRSARFLRLTSEEELKSSLVPEYLPGMLLKSEKLNSLPLLHALVEVPIFLPDGRILSEPGWDSKSGIYFQASHKYIPVKENPSLDDAKKAAKFIFDVVSDFPFSETPSPMAHQAAFLGFLMTGLGRFAIWGPVPFVLLDASAAASGKGLLAQVAASIILGRSVPVNVAPTSGEELQKVILAGLRAGNRLMLLDEAPCPFGGREWNGLITAFPNYEGRILGESTLVVLPQNAIWVVTGNNISLMNDSTRRCLHIRLEPRVENPENRDDFKIPNLLDFVQQHHAELVHAVLTILRGFHVAGRPTSNLHSWGSFTAWSDLVRNAVFWVTGVDCDTRKGLAGIADFSRAATSTLLEGLHHHFGSAPFTTQDVLRRYESNDQGFSGFKEAIESLNSNPRGITAKSLGHLLSSTRKTVHNGKCLDALPNLKDGALVWKILLFDSTGGSGDDSLSHEVQVV